MAICLYTTSLALVYAIESVTTSQKGRNMKGVKEFPSEVVKVLSRPPEDTTLDDIFILRKYFKGLTYEEQKRLQTSRSFVNWIVNCSVLDSPEYLKRVEVEEEERERYGRKGEYSNYCGVFRVLYW